MMTFTDDRNSEISYITSLSNPIQFDGIEFCSVNIVMTETKFIRVFGADSRVHIVGLHKDLLKASIKRRSEFLAGRLCCALNMISFNAPTHIGRIDRRPMWPSPYVGSVSHTDSYAVAITSRTHQSLGIDLASILADDVISEVKHLICTNSDFQKKPFELTLSAYITLVLSAKEALFKAISYKLSWLPNFIDCNVVSIDSSEVCVEFLGTIYPINWAMTEPDIITVCKI